MQINGKHITISTGVVLSVLGWAGNLGYHAGLAALDRRIDERVQAVVEAHEQKDRSTWRQVRRDVRDNTLVLYVIEPTLPKREQILIDTLRNAAAQKIREGTQ